MERDGQLELYDRLAARLKEAHTRVRTLQVPEGVRVALQRKLLVITAAAKHDLADAERRVERLMADIDAGRLPEEQARNRTDGTR
jgi:cell division protein YceG involved in septum cleavage